MILRIQLVYYMVHNIKGNGLFALQFKVNLIIEFIQYGNFIGVVLKSGTGIVHRIKDNHI